MRLEQPPVAWRASLWYCSSLNDADQLQTSASFRVSGGTMGKKLENASLVLTRFARVSRAIALGAAIVVSLSGLGAFAQNAGTIHEAQSIAEEAYLYGFPMIVNYKVMFEYAIDRTSGQFKAPFNQISNEARVFTPKDTTIVTPNSDTPYSVAELDLRAEPIVLCVPEIEKARYYDVQLVDMYTDNYGYMGSRTTGNSAGCYMVAGPDWSAEQPAGVARTFRSETQFGLVIYRTQLFNAADMDNVKKVQAGYKIQTLSAFLGRPAPPPAPVIAWPKFEQDAFTTRFGEYLSFRARAIAT
jgi:hypothetical protein